jgi:linoleoyl-CoA desaturase
VVLHHSYVNIAGHDNDIDVGPLARLTPHQRVRWYYRWQQLYLWPLYGLMAINWHFVGDFHDLITGRIGKHRVSRPRRWNLVTLIVGKLIFVVVAFGIPLAVHSVWVVALFYAAVTVVLGTLLAVVFQLAHCVEEAQFASVPRDTGRIERAWAVHQVEATVDFSRRNRLLAWFLGGLNFQIEHHLFPRICHVNYPAMSRVVEQACRDFGVTFNEHPSFWAGVASHFRWLRRMGKADAGR